MLTYPLIQFWWQPPVKSNHFQPAEYQQFQAKLPVGRNSTAHAHLWPHLAKQAATLENCNISSNSFGIWSSANYEPLCERTGHIKDKIHNWLIYFKMEIILLPYHWNRKQPMSTFYWLVLKTSKLLEIESYNFPFWFLVQADLRMLTQVKLVTRV